MEEQDTVTVEQDSSNIGSPVWMVEIESSAIAFKRWVIPAINTTKEEAISLAKNDARRDIESDDLSDWKLLGLWKSGIISAKKAEWSLELNGTLLHPKQLRLPMVGK